MSQFTGRFVAGKDESIFCISDIGRVTASVVWVVDWHHVLLTPPATTVQQNTHLILNWHHVLLPTPPAITVQQHASHTQLASCPAADTTCHNSTTTRISYGTQLASCPAADTTCHNSTTTHISYGTQLASCPAADTTCHNSTTTCISNTFKTVTTSIIIIISISWHSQCVTLTFAERFRLVFSLSDFANLSTKITTKQKFRLSLSFLLSENT